MKRVKIRGFDEFVMKGYLAAFFFASLTVLIVGRPFYLSGYFFALDWSFPREVSINNLFYGLRGYWEFVYAELPFHLILYGLNLFLPTWLLQKLIIFFIFFISGFSAYKLLSRFSYSAGFYAGVLYCVNPFVYVRFLSGQWGNLLGYAFLPLSILSFMNLLEVKSVRSAFIYAFLLSVVSVFSLHMALLSSFVCLILLASHILNMKSCKRVVKPLASSASLYLALNLYWLLPVLTAKEDVLFQFTLDDFYIFSAKPQVNNIYFTLLSLHGFWRGGYRYTFEVISGWQYISIAFILLAVLGFIHTFKNEGRNTRIYAYGLAASAAASLIFASGASGAFKDINLLLFENTVFFKVFRDTQKFIVVIILFYAFLGGLGVKSILSGLKGRRTLQTVAAAALITLPLIYQFNMPLGFNGQLKTYDYPNTWYEVNTYLNSDSEDFNTLFLPWHNYMHFKWAESNIANPADVFFDKPVIRAQNIEVGPIYTHSTHPAQQYLDYLLPKAPQLHNLGELLTPLNVKYVILAKEADYTNYLYLYNQTDLNPVFENEDLIVFRNEKYAGRIYTPETVVKVSGYEDLIELSQTIDLSRSAITATHVMVNKTSYKKIPYKIETPITYRINITEGIIVFTPPNLSAEGWTLEGKPSLETLGFQAIYINQRGDTITYERFHKTYLPAYIASASTAIAAAIYLLSRKPSSIQKPQCKA
ncbi:MAG: hypothetical protein QW282_05990 [Nitrososphaerales archaeon]